MDKKITIYDYEVVDFDDRVAVDDRNSGWSHFDYDLFRTEEEMNRLIKYHTQRMKDNYPDKQIKFRIGVRSGDSSLYVLSYYKNK